MSKLIASAHPRAFLALADGTVFEGFSFGAPVVQVGEVVFNTSLSGYQEICTDPSYARQIVTLTYPHIGNVGCNPQDEESAKVHLSGLVIRDLPLVVSNFRSATDLSSYLNEHGVPGI
ncbi:MAG: carbamoyl-phosphate synthase domain-containing protein, partial [Limnobacter sp.]|nr:carbamoyl-phosphate synthase domain-containing protein [Limnobacter sp.]